MLGLLTICRIFRIVTLFSGAALSLTELPEGLFTRFTGATDFSSAFYGCTALAAVPDGLFSELSQVTLFTSVFENCTRLLSAGKNTFRSCAAATNFTSAFSGCISLIDTGTGIFDGCVSWKWLRLYLRWMPRADNIVTRFIQRCAWWRLYGDFQELHGADAATAAPVPQLPESHAFRRGIQWMHTAAFCAR